MADPDRLARSIIQIVNLIFSKLFLRAIVLFLLLVFVSSFLPWTKELYSGLFSKPELRIEQFSPENIQVNHERWYQRVATIENRGNSTANQVYISAVVPWGRISRYRVFSEYPYDIHPSTNTSEGYLLITLQQLAPGAKVTVYIWGPQHAYLDEPGIAFSAVYDSGSAPDSTSLSSSEQMKAIAENVISSFQNSIDFVVQNEKFQKLISGEAFSEIDYMTIPTIPSYLLVTSFVVGFLAWLFLDSIKAALIHGALAASIYWLRLDNFFLPPFFIMVSTLPIFVFLVSREGLLGFLRHRLGELIVGGKEQKIMAAFGFDRENWWRFILSLVVLAIGLLLQFEMLNVGSPEHQLASFLTVGYIVTMLSLAFTT